MQTKLHVNTFTIFGMFYAGVELIDTKICLKSSGIFGILCRCQGGVVIFFRLAYVAGNIPLPNEEIYFKKGFVCGLGGKSLLELFSLAIVMLGGEAALNLNFSRPKAVSDV